ncbi:MAG TPA: pitrilysin family protein [Candidatus Glassbacteria bacterium]|nr:pitrilysin family protein [Candidatus Glassbacteria bacterium]
MINPLVIKRKTLPNGIRLVQFPRSQKMTAQLSVVIHHGSKISSEKNAGIAHYLEHMVGGGSKEHIKAMHSIEQNGGFLDLSTELEYTVGSADIFPEKLDEISELLSKLFFQYEFEEKKFDLEKKVILNEIAESFDEPWNIVDDMLRKNLYNIHPVRHPILGYPKTVSKFSFDEIIEAKKTYCTPQNTILILSGKYSDRNVESVVQNFLEIVKSKKLSKKYNYIEKEKPKKISRKTKTGISPAYLGFGYRTASGKHPDNPALELFSATMGTGESSRLFRELREKRALAYRIESSNCNGEDFGFFSIQCAVKSSKIKETTNLILKEITNLKTKKVSDEELSKVKNMVIGDFFRGIDHSLVLHLQLARLEILFADECAIPKYLEKIKSVSENDLIEVANKYLGESNSSMALLTSEK